MNNYSPAQSKAIKKLKELKESISLTGEQGLQSRIEFVCIAFDYNLKEDLIRYELYDQHYLGEREYDTCFEMNDGDLVVHGIINKAKTNSKFKSKLKSLMGAEYYNEWVLVFERVKESNLALLDEHRNTSQLNFAM